METTDKIATVFTFRNSLKKHSKFFFLVSLLLLLPTIVMASNGKMPTLAGIRLEFILFGLTLIGVAVFHKHTMYVSILGLVSVIIVKLIFTPEFSFVGHFIGTAERQGEWHILLNLLGLLIGFAILARHFEESKLPEILPNYLPNDWKGGLVLLFFIMVLATFLDSIASAMIGGAIAYVVFNKKVHLGYLVAIVAASNAGGSGSVLGNMPTTMMWIDGVNPLDVTHGFIGALASFAIFGVAASIQQDRYQRIQRDSSANVKLDFGKLSIVIMILVFAILFNWLIGFPALGVWIGILIGATYRKTSWDEIPKSIQGAVFLLGLVTCASLMPVKELPAASWKTAFGLGFVSAVFDNIPLTKLCLDQGGYDWGMLAYTVGFGGSMIWFGSSAGVAISNRFSEAKSVINYVKKGWHVWLAYIVGFFIMLYTMGWNPTTPHKKDKNPPMTAPIKNPDIK
jgi:Na+/H+ antiporter NhaD/arsenite permease-like protein